MDDPIFTLKSVVKTKGELQDFTGPLALILQLLSKNKIEIRDISISQILDQYLGYLATMADMDLEIASEFVAMASHLLYIKTKTLVSGQEDVDELSELISSLEDLRRRDIYARVKAVTAQLEAMYRSSYGLMVKLPEYIAPDNTYRFEHDISDLIRAFLQVIDREELLGTDASKTILYPKRITYSVTEKASEILERLRLGGAARIMSLIREAESRSEMVAVFIAVLELCRTGAVFLVGVDEELTICAGSDTLRPEALETLDEALQEY